MSANLPLRGVRVHLSGSIPETAVAQQSQGIAAFARALTTAVLREGGTLVHGSHPTLRQPLAEAAGAFVSAGGDREALTLVRAQRYAVTPEQRAEVEAERQYGVVQLIPANPDKPGESLVPMREWMAERCDVVVAIGGKHYDVNKA